MPFRPMKWVLYSPIAVLPFLASVVLEGRSMQARLASEAEAGLNEAEAVWAKAVVNGRDLTLSGDAPSNEQLDRAVAAVTGLYGIRRVDVAARVVELPPPQPVVGIFSGQGINVVLSGTWPEGKGNSLAIALAGRTYVSGSDAALSSDGQGSWKLALPGLLKPGKYDVSATVTSKSGLSSSDSSKDEVEIAEPPELRRPTVQSLESRLSSPTIEGTWDSAVARSLAVTVGPATYRLGSDQALSSAGDKWSLRLPAKLPEGSYDIRVEAGDDFGRAAQAETGKLVIDTTAPELPVIRPVSQTGPLSISGTLPSDAVSLVARLAGRIWTLGSDPAIATGGNGTWTLRPDVKLDPGTYDLSIEIADKAGNVSRDATANEIVIPEPPPLTAPTVNPLVTNNSLPVLTGTWPSAVATALAIRVDDTTYNRGKAVELTSTGDDWTLKLASPLDDGDYAVTAEISDSLGRVTKTASPSTLIVDTKPPAAPSVTSFSGILPLRVTGTWPEADAGSLTVSLEGRTWVLGKDAGLASDGKGGWTFAPELELQPGTYDLQVEVSDRAGNASRDSTTDEIVIPAPAVMERPTVKASEETMSRPSITGTWSEIAAKTLSVGIAGQTYVLGKNPELASDGIGHWTLKHPLPLAEGSYDVTVTSTDAKGQSLTDATRNELIIDARGPAAPAVHPYAGSDSPRTVSGTWDWENSKTLRVAIPSASISADLGKNPALVSAAGQWTLTLPSALPPGSYDVIASSADAKGRVSADQTRFEILVKEPLPSPPAMKAPTVVAYSGVETPRAIMGTWDEGPGRSLFVSIGNSDVRAALGSDDALTSDGIGDWTLALDTRLKPGVYDVVVEAVDEAGNRVSDVSTAEIFIKEPPPPPPVMKLPTVNSISAKDSPTVVTGTWDEGVATSLFVSLPDVEIRTALGSDPALTSDGKGNWSLALDKPLAPGRYDVVVETSDPAGNRTLDTSASDIEIAPPPPLPMKIPTVISLSTDASPSAISGTWDEGRATALFVSIEDTPIRAALGSDAALTSDGKGNWSLALQQVLKPGIYNVIVETADADGNRISDASAAEIRIRNPEPQTAPQKANPQSPPQPQFAPLDCGAALSGILGKAHIRFGFDRWELGDEAKSLIADVGQLLTDERCKQIKLEVIGHADDQGGRLYNEALSIYRATVVFDALVAAGIAADRMTSRGVGETEPEVRERTLAARASNRRVVLTIAN
jgi:outer membrane protein OmpA-like peptidoglycan-associated protein